MNIHVIKTERDYEKALEIIDSLLDSPQGSEESERLEVISILVEDYEMKHFKIDVPDPISAIKQRLEDLSLTKKDLENSIGSRSRISEIFNRKRSLTLPMIRRLHKSLNIPAEILIAESTKKSA
jgi:HTH-type transcriptional regulator/antitoxin HigA